MENFNIKKIALAGGTGFIGKALQDSLTQNGYDVVILPRSSYQGDTVALKDQLNGCFAVINLAGAPIGRRWTNSYKKEILNSRVLSTANICKAISLCPQPPRRFISASAVGIYNSRDRHDESSTAYENDFLSSVCIAWEAQLQQVKSITEAITIRLGIVIGSKGGTLKKLLPLFRSGLGGSMGRGDQPFPVVHLYDVCTAVVHILKTSRPSPVYNLTNPETTTNHEFTKALAKALGRPSFISIPSFALKLMFGKRSALFLKGQNVIPANLLSEGFSFRFTTVNQPGFFSE